MAKLTSTIKKAFKSITKGVTISENELYDYSTPESRESTIMYLYDYARAERQAWVERWQTYDQYYQGKHVTALEIKDFCEKNNIPWIPACVQDPFMHVESQIQPDVPDFEFNGRDDDLDSTRAKQREYVVKFVLDNNHIEDMNPDNERRLNKLGNAIWKVYWDASVYVPYSKTNGDIMIRDVDPANIFPDPSAYTLEDCEYIDYSYRLHKMKTGRVFGAQLEARGINVKSIGNDGNWADTQIYNSRVQSTRDDTVQVIEHWFRQPEAGKDKREIVVPDPRTGKDKIVEIPVEWEAGDMACSILINLQEIQYIPKYWMNTGKQNKRYPFVKYCKIADENNFWDRSELASIIDLVDAADREMAYGLLNDAFTANDIIVMEQGTLADGQAIDNRPGATVTTKPGQINNIRRLGGLANMPQRENTIQFLQSQIERTIGNFDTSMGVEPTKVTTASGIAQMNERADARKSIKKADRINGFESLFELIDWTALEFYDDDRIIFLGAKDDDIRQQYLQQMQQSGQQVQQNLDKTKGPIIFKYNSKKFKVLDGMGEVDNPDNPQISYYYPRVDCRVYASDALSKSKAFTVQALQDLIKTPVNMQNYKMVEAYVDLLQLADRKTIKDDIEGSIQYQKSMPYLLRDLPRLVFNFADFPQDARAQILQQMGVESDGGITPEEQTDLQRTQIQANAKQQASPSQQNISIDNLLNGLSPEELQHLKENPHLLAEFAQQHGIGGNI